MHARECASAELFAVVRGVVVRFVGRGECVCAPPRRSAAELSLSVRW